MFVFLCVFVFNIMAVYGMLWQFRSKCNKVSLTLIVTCILNLYIFVFVCFCICTHVLAVYASRAVQIKVQRG